MGNIHIGRKTRPRVMLIGLESSGKTALFFRLTRSAFVHSTLPTIGLSTDNARLRTASASGNAAVDVKIWDVGGLYSQRQLWGGWLRHADVCVFVVDSSDPRGVAESRDELSRLVRTGLLGNPTTPVLVVANKQDADGAIDPVQMVQELDLVNVMGSRAWNVLACSSATGVGVQGVVDFLRMTLLSRPNIQQKRRKYHHRMQQSPSRTSPSTSLSDQQSGSMLRSSSVSERDGRISRTSSSALTALQAIRAAEAADEAGDVIPTLVTSLSHPSRHSRGSMHTSSPRTLQTSSPRSTLVSPTLSHPHVFPPTLPHTHSPPTVGTGSGVGGGVGGSGLSVSPITSPTPTSSQHSPTSPSLLVKGDAGKNRYLLTVDVSAPAATRPHSDFNDQTMGRGRFNGPSLQSNLLPLTAPSRGGSGGEDDARLDHFLQQQQQAQFQAGLHAGVHAHNTSAEQSPASSRGRLPSVLENEELDCPLEEDPASSGPMAVFFRSAQAAQAQMQWPVRGSKQPQQQQQQRAGGSEVESDDDDESSEGGEGGGDDDMGDYESEKSGDSDDEGAEDESDEDESDDEHQHQHQGHHHAVVFPPHISDNTTTTSPASVVSPPSPLPSSIEVVNTGANKIVVAPSVSCAGNGPEVNNASAGCRMHVATNGWGVGSRGNLGTMPMVM